MLTITLVRHGETDSQKPDFPLTKKGHLQAEYIVDKLHEQSYDKVYVSSLLRAKQTANYFLKKYAGEVIETSDLEEIYRVIVGGNIKVGTRPHREEEDLERIERITKILLHEKGNILVFCHGNVIRYILSRVLKINSKKAGFFDNYNCSTTCIYSRKGQLFLRYVNRTILPKRLRS